MRMTRASVVVGVLALVACDPPTIRTPEVQTGEVSVVYNYPADKQADVLPDAPVIVIFSDDVNDARLGEFVSVSRDGTDVSGAVTYDAGDSEMTWIPQGGVWAAATNYVVTIKKGLPSKDGGKTLPEDFPFSFTTK